MKIDVFNSLCKEAQEEFLKLALAPAAPFSGAQRLTTSVGKVLKPVQPAVANAVQTASHSVGKVLPPTAVKAPTPPPRLPWHQDPAMAKTVVAPGMAAQPKPKFIGPVQRELPSLPQGSLELSKAQLQNTPAHNLVNNASPREFMRSMKAHYDTGVAPAMAHNLLQQHDLAMIRRQDMSSGFRRAAADAATPAPVLRKIVLPPVTAAA